MTNKKYTYQEIRDLFPKQAKTRFDINIIAQAIYNYTPEITLQASKFKQAKDGGDINIIADAIYNYTPEIVKQASEDKKAETGYDIYIIAKKLYQINKIK